MKGKKKDHEFLSQFIEECISLNKNSSKDILDEAKLRIKNIDNRIIETEKLKLQRSKLFDVIDTFEITTKKTSDEAEMLPFFKIKNIATCKNICDKLKIAPLTLNKLDHDMIFCLKQLLELEVIKKDNNLFVKGAKFNEYVKFVLFGN